MQNIKEFLSRDDIREIIRQEKGKTMENSFFRDPLRTITINKDLLYSVADGIVLYAKEVGPDEQYEIKGDKFTVQDMLSDPDYKERSLVVGVFMSWLDVHVNRVPAGCYFLETKTTGPMQTHGVSMILQENNLLEDFSYKKKDNEFLRFNEKRINKFYCPAIKGALYIVQVADKDVDCCITWRKGQFLTQGDRFGQIRYGSQCDIIIPLNKKRDYKILVSPLDHVEAGIDPILSVS